MKRTLLTSVAITILMSSALDKADDNEFVLLDVGDFLNAK